jgi:hypothetical protein
MGARAAAARRVRISVFEHSNPICSAQGFVSRIAESAGADGISEMRVGDSRGTGAGRGVFRKPKLAPGGAHRILSELGFTAILTTNFD